MEDNRKYRARKVMMVELKIPLDDTPDILFFGSKKAIFEYFGDALGITYGYLRTLNVRDKPYENNRCKIVEGTILTDTAPEILERRRKEGREPLPSKGGYQSRKNQEQEPE